MTAYLGTKSYQRPSRMSLPPPQDPCPAPLAPVRELDEGLGEVTNPQSADGKASPEAVALSHELVEALTATGNYLSAATRLLAGELRSPEDKLGDALAKSLTQFARAAEAVRHLRAAILSIKPSRE